MMLRFTVVLTTPTIKDKKMSQTKTPSPLMFNVETANLLPKNVAGIGTDPEITKASDENLQATERLVKSLEERYANPNYFKVASGFLKPHRWFLCFSWKCIRSSW